MATEIYIQEPISFSRGTCQRLYSVTTSSERFFLIHSLSPIPSVYIYVQGRIPRKVINFIRLEIEQDNELIRERFESRGSLANKYIKDFNQSTWRHL